MSMTHYQGTDEMTRDTGESEVPAPMSPFPMASLIGEAFDAGVASEHTPFGYGESANPFRIEPAGYVARDDEAEMLAELLAELEDEDFEQVLAEVTDRAAMLELRADSEYGSVSPGAAAWLEQLTAHAEHAIDQISSQLEAFGPSFEPSALPAEQLDEALASMTVALPPGLSELEEQFLGGWVNKAKAAISGAAKLARKGLAVAGRLFPLNALMGRLRGFVRPIIERILRAARGALPESVRPLADQLAMKLGITPPPAATTAPAADPLAAGSAAGGLADAGDAATGNPAAADGDAASGEAFDLRLAGLLFAPDGFETGSFEAGSFEAESFGAGPQYLDPTGELGVARRGFAEQLASMPPGSDPTAAIQQFVPAVMAAMPMVRLAVRALGKQRIAGALAQLIAPLVAGQVGSEAARKIARPLADAGLRLLGLEVPAGEDLTLAGEALAATVEETVGAALLLDRESLADELQLAATVQTAFAEAAGRHLPAAMIRSDLAEREIDGARGVWVLMPRPAAPRFRYKKYSNVFVVPITRQIASVVPWTDGGTMQTHLEDEGVTAWPVQAEVHVYETLPGTRLGHLASDETAGEAALSAPALIGELQPLSEATAGVLLREPRMGTPAGAGAARAVDGRSRYFRLVVPGMRPVRRGRPRRRAAIRLVIGTSPALRIAVRLSEREGQELAERLERKDTAGALAWMNARTGRLRTRVVNVLARGAARSQSLPFKAGDVNPLGQQVIAALAAASSAELARTPERFSPVVRDVAQGLTVVYTIPLAGEPASSGGTLRATTEIAPGWVRP